MVRSRGRDGFLWKMNLGRLSSFVGVSSLNSSVGHSFIKASSFGDFVLQPLYLN